VDVGHHFKRGDPARIAREAESLALARHPGVVELVGIEGDPLDPRLVTRRVEGPTLAGAGTLSRAEAAGVAAAVASTLTDLHRMGFVHGAIVPDHVIVDRGGRPVLCSFGYGGRAGEPSPAPPGDPLDPSIDVYGLGALLRFLLADGCQSGSDPLFRLAEEATVPDAAKRPTAAQFASAINDAVPDACLPGAAVARNVDALDALRRSHAVPSLRRHEKSRNRRTVLVAVAGILMVSVGAVAVHGLSVAGSGAAAPIRDPLLPSVASTTAPAPAAPTCPVVDGILAADTDGDGCLERLEYAGGVLESASARWSVGNGGDQVATGDWACRGQTLVAVLHPATGDVFLFDGLAGLDQDLVTNPVLRVDGGFALRSAGIGSDGCQQLLVDRRDGPPVVVPARRGA
jgi:hypothetical protein